MSKVLKDTTLFLTKRKKKSKKGKAEENDITKIILRYSNEHDKIRRILTKYWPILTEDPNLRSLVTKSLQITHKKAGSICEKLVQSEYKGGLRGDPCKTWGTFPRKSYSQCPVIGRRTQFSLPSGDFFRVKHFANCKTRGVVYLMQCQCGAFYVGKTKQELG